MDKSNASGEDNENSYWDTEDELEIENINLVAMNSQVIISNGEASSSANSNLVQQFLDMGFSEKLVSKAIKENGEDNPDSILEALLTSSALEDSVEEDKSVNINSIQQQECVDKDEFSSEYDDSLLDGFSDSDSWSDSELAENDQFSPKHDNTVILFASMGYTLEEARAAMERCGTDASIAELTDFICAAQMAKTDAVFFEDEKPKNLYGETHKLKRKLHELNKLKRKKQKGPLTEEDDVIRLPKPMIGYGVPSESSIITHRTLPEAAIGPPFFYYENVALAPKGVWDEIARFLYDIEPEFVDSNYFCAAARKRGYVHNLPINNRFPILPLPARTITDALPLTKRWWPKWDKRTKLNCMQTSYASSRLTDRIRKALDVQKYVIEECRRWNLVWVGKNKVAPLEPDEVEMLLGFPRNHTRGSGVSRTDRYKSLGNSFQVDISRY